MVGRRCFLTLLSQLSAGVMLSAGANAPERQRKKDRLGEWLPVRKLGDTGEDVTMLGMGGWHFGEGEDKDGLAILEEALQRGVRFIDCASEYQNGGSEQRMGRILTPKYRDVVFLMTKAIGKDAKSVEQELDNSLKNMKTDHLDLWQIHSIESPEDVDRRIENGVLDVFLQAKESGKVRYIGFTGHRNYRAHLRMLERTKNSNPFDACQMPINALDPSYKSFIVNVLPKLVERKIGVIAMKTLAFGKFFDKNMRPGEKQKEDNKPNQIIPGRMSLKEALHFVWSLPVSVLVSGMLNPNEVKENAALAKNWEPMEPLKREALISKISDMAGNQIEWYKE
ncbi:MAG: aldo/keto reductase [Candidatus Omnitrophica bacterium]|nr:aldo/keto reductase [Candidatus Omnitrophota bacterium]